MAVRIVEIVVLLGACAAVIAILRHPQSLKRLAIPAGILALLSVVGVFIALSAPRYRIAAADHEMPVYDSVYETFNANAVSGVWERPAPVHNATWSRLAMLTAIVLIPMVGGAAVFGSRKWIARDASVLIPLAVVGFAGVLVFGVFALYSFQDMREDARRVEVRQRLRSMGEAFRHGSSYAEGARSSSSETVSPDVHENADVAIEVPIASSEESAANPETETKVAVTDLPQWARGETVDWRTLRDGVHQNPVVLVSDQWSSVEESEIQLEAMAAQALQQQLLMDRGSYRWQPSKDFIHQSGAIQQRFVEQTSLKVGEFDTPMFRSYWQVAATPYVSSLAQKEWKAAAVQERLTMLGAGAAVLTLLFAGGAAGLRFDSATGGRYRRRMAAAAVAVGALAAGTAALFVA